MFYNTKKDIYWSYLLATPLGDLVRKCRLIDYIMHGILLAAGADVDDVLFCSSRSLAIRCQACLGQTIPERRASDSRPNDNMNEAFKHTSRSEHIV